MTDARDIARRTTARTTRALVQHLPPRRRGLRLVSAVERLVDPPSTPMLSRHVSGYWITCDLRDSVQRSLFYKGTIEERASLRLRNALRPGDVFLDVGANSGHFTFLAAKVVGPTGHVHAVEAAPEMATQLESDVRRNELSARVTVYGVAIANATGTLRLQDAPGQSPYGQRYLDPGATTEGTEVKVVRIDDLLPNVSPAAVKIDIEGADLQALYGMREMLTARPPRLVLCEAVDSQLSRFGDSERELVEYMTSLGYAVADVSEPGESRELAFEK